MTDIYFTVCYSITVVSILIFLFLIAADTHRAHRRLNALHESLNNLSTRTSFLELVSDYHIDRILGPPPPAAA